MNKNPNYSIAIKVNKEIKNSKFDESCSKFFGKPCLPKSLLNKYSLDTIFLAQINCQDFAELDPENRLPHKGYLYFFIEVKTKPYIEFNAIIDYILEEPEYIIDDFNDYSFMEGLNDAYLISFEKKDAYYEGTKLLGYPTNDIDDTNDKNSLLLQYDPLDFDVTFLNTCDGYAFIFYNLNKKIKSFKTKLIVWSS